MSMLEATTHLVVLVLPSRKLTKPIQFVPDRRVENTNHGIDKVERQGYRGLGPAGSPCCGRVLLYPTSL